MEKGKKVLARAQPEPDHWSFWISFSKINDESLNEYFGFYFELNNFLRCSMVDE